MFETIASYLLAITARCVTKERVGQRGGGYLCCIALPESILSPISYPRPAEAIIFGFAGSGQTTMLWRIPACCSTISGAMRQKERGTETQHLHKCASDWVRLCRLFDAGLQSTWTPPTCKLDALRIERRLLCHEMNTKKSREGVRGTPADPLAGNTRPAHALNNRIYSEPQCSRHCSTRVCVRNGPWP